MGKAREIVRYLTAPQIIKTNRLFIFKWGGLYDYAGIPQNPSSLEYLIEAVRSEIFGTELYPSLASKAAVYAFNIITRHVFYDGNKRTGMASALWFLDENGKETPELNDESVIEMAVRIASGDADFEATVRWFEDLV